MKENYLSYKPWLVCLGAALFFYFVFFQLAMFNTISHDVMRDFNLSATDLGYLSSSYFFADAFFIIPAGILLSRFSVRKIILVVMFSCVVATYWFAYTHSFTEALFCRVINGIGNAFAFLSSMLLASRWLPPRRLALGISLIITIFMVGGMIAQTPLMLLVNSIGWRHATLLNATLGLAFFGYVFYILEDYPPNKKIEISKITWLETMDAFKQALKLPQNWVCSWYITLVNFPIIILGELWGVLYLTEAKSLSLTAAGNIATMLFLGMIMGSPAWGWLSDTFNNRRIPMLCASLLLAVITWVLIGVGLSFSALMIVFFLMGVLSSGQSLGYPVMAEVNPPEITSMAMSIVAVLLNAVSFFVQPLFGWLVALGHPSISIGSVAVYTPHDFERAMWLLPIACLAAFVLAWRLRYRVYAAS